MTDALPPRIFPGRIGNIAHPAVWVATLDIGFGVHVDKTLALEGVECRNMHSAIFAAARHCMCILLGGKRLLVAVNYATLDARIPARVYVNETNDGNPAYVVAPHGMERPLIEVGAFFQWVQARNFAIDLVKDALRKTRAD